MQDSATLIDAIVQLGKAVLPLVVPGSEKAIEAGERMIEMIDHAKDALVGSDADVAKLEETRDEFEARVNELVGDTISRLRGEE